MKETRDTFTEKNMKDVKEKKIGVAGFEPTLY